jgi:hypothetical protein
MPRPSSLSALWAELLKPRPELFVTESESDSELKPEPQAEPVEDDAGEVAA